MKIAFFNTTITPPVGTLLAGYAAHDVSVAQRGELIASVLCMDDGSRRALMIGLDLIGMDAPYIQRLRRECAAMLGSSDADVIVTCTHTHGGPHTRSSSSSPADDVYTNGIIGKITDDLKKMLARDEFTETEVFFYSAQVNANVNRRYCGAENIARFIPHFRDMEKIADGPVDPEVGMLFFFIPGTADPAYAIVNYAAHPLASHSPGRGGHTLTPDFPALIRDRVRSDTGAECMFVSGACGDLCPRDSEAGFAAAEMLADPVARAVVGGMVSSSRNRKWFQMKEAKLASAIRTFEVPLRKGVNSADAQMPVYLGKDRIETEVQVLSVGEICFVGVPGELLAEVGLEIKWNSPFRRAFVLYNSTGYLSYLCHVNAFVAGGYESNCTPLDYRMSLQLVENAVDAMFEIHGPLQQRPMYLPGDDLQ